MSAIQPGLFFVSQKSPNPVDGETYLDPSTNGLMVWTGSQWTQASASASASASSTTDWYLFVDDERNPEDAGWHSGNIVVARTSKEAQDLVETRGLPASISFDHDLGGDDTAFKFMWALINGHMDGKWDISKMSHIQIHTANSVGREKLIKLWDNFCRTQQITSTVKQVWPKAKE